MDQNRTKLRALGMACLWAVAILIFPLASGILSNVLNSSLLTTRLSQASGMLLAFIAGWQFVRSQKTKLSDWFIQPASVKWVHYALPLVVVLPMLLRGIRLPEGSLIVATLLFVLAVGLAEELYFRSIGLYYLRQAFSKPQAIVLSSIIFGLSHALIALANPSLTVVSLAILNAILYGFFAASWAFASRSIYYLVLHRALFNLLDYTHALTGNELILAYVVRGLLLLVIGWYYFRKNTLSRSRN